MGWLTCEASGRQSRSTAQIGFTCINNLNLSTVVIEKKNSTMVEFCIIHIYEDETVSVRF